jgi:multidrug efflux pump subunit AcrA (membrane-fusion protein)
MLFMDNARQKAGKALIIFLALMAALTMLSNTLQAMVVPVVTPTLPQRGALEHRVYADGTLAPSSEVAVIAGVTARVTEVIAKVGQKVSRGEALAMLDMTDVLKERHKNLMDALGTLSERRQSYDWAAADIGKGSLKTLEDRRKSLKNAENKRDEAKEALDELINAEASEREIDEARAVLKSARDSVDHYKRSLDQLVASREYVRAGKELAQAEQALDLAWKRYFDAYYMLDGASILDEGKLRAEALRQVEYGGSAEEVIILDPDSEYPSTLRAEISGEVMEVNIKPGQIISTTEAALTLGDLSHGLSLTVTVNSDDASLIEVGDVSEVIIGDERVDCRVLSVRASVDNPDRYELELAVPEGIGSIGLRGSMRFRKKTASYDLLIPLGALREDGRGEFVYVVERQESSLGSGMKVRRVEVYSIDKDATRAALQGGITQRDILALRGDRGLSDGDSVRLEED